MKKILSNILRFLSADGDYVVSPLYDGITLIGPYAIGVCLALSMFWAIFLGVKYAKAEDPAEKENLHKVLLNFCIGAVVILTLIVLLYSIREPLVRLIDAD